jgi:2-haloacid dehalogenase
MFSPDRRKILRALLSSAFVVPVMQPSPLSLQRRNTILVFDVNETLLDIAALAPQFTRLFGRAEILHEWFSTVVLYSQVSNIAGPYAEFGTIARAALEMTAAAHGVSLPAAARDNILKGLVTLPAHPDVRPGLDKLRAAGFRMVTLTNSAPAAVEQQLTNAGLNGYFERRISVDAVRRFKPAAEVYQLAAQELAVQPSNLRLIAAHAWDVLGALRAGCRAAFVARPGKALYPMADRPDIVGATVTAVADQVINVDSAK